MKQPTSMVDDDFAVVRTRSALLRLPDTYRAPLVLQVRFGRSPEEIASELNLTVSQVLTRLCRARQQLLLLCHEGAQADEKHE